MSGNGAEFSPPPSSTELLNLQEQTRLKLEIHGALEPDWNAFGGWKGKLPIFDRAPFWQRVIAGTTIRETMPDDAEDLAVDDYVQIAYYLPHFSQMPNREIMTTQFAASTFVIDKLPNELGIDFEALSIEKNRETKLWTSSRFCFDADGDEIVSDKVSPHMTKEEHWALIELIGAIGVEL